MRYAELVETLKDPFVQTGNCSKVRSMEQAASAILDLTAQVKTLESANRILSTRITKTEEENRKLRDILVQIRKTDRVEKCSVVFEMTYSDALSHDQLGSVAALVFQGLMKADLDRRKSHE